MMNPFRPTDWEKDALRSALSGGILGTGIVLLEKGFNWLISAKTSREDDFYIIFVLAVVFYFNEAINSIHERLSEIERAVKK